MKGGVRQSTLCMGMGCLSFHLFLLYLRICLVLSCPVFVIVLVLSFLGGSVGRFVPFLLYFFSFFNMSL